MHGRAGPAAMVPVGVGRWGASADRHRAMACSPGRAPATVGPSSATLSPVDDAGGAATGAGGIMRKVLLTAVRAAVVAALILTAVSAEAQHDRRRRWVTEFDAATAGAIATLLVGGGILIRNRRRP